MIITKIVKSFDFYNCGCNSRRDFIDPMVLCTHRAISLQLNFRWELPAKLHSGLDSMGAIITIGSSYGNYKRRNLGWWVKVLSLSPVRVQPSAFRSYIRTHEERRLNISFRGLRPTALSVCKAVFNHTRPKTLL